MKLDVNKIYHIDELKDFELPERTADAEDGKQVQFSTSIQDQLQEFLKSDKNEWLIFFFRWETIKNIGNPINSMLHVERIKVIK